MYLKEMLVADACRVLSGSPSADEVLERMVQALAETLHGGLPASRATVAIEALRAREREASTAFGLGVAIPHCFLEGFGPARLSIAVSVSGVDFHAMDGSLTHVFFLLIEDLAARGSHAALISRIARLCLETRVLASIRGARDGQEITSILADAELELD